MASIFIPAPGTEYGPCADDCAHTDCAADREMATALCVRCQKPIGYETGFFSEDDDHAHARCVLAALEQAAGGI